MVLGEQIEPFERLLQRAEALSARIEVEGRENLKQFVATAESALADLFEAEHLLADARNDFNTIESSNPPEGGSEAASELQNLKLDLGLQNGNG